MLEARNISKSYGGVTAVDHLDLRVDQAGVYGIIGLPAPTDATAWLMAVVTRTASGGKNVRMCWPLDGSDPLKDEVRGVVDWDRIRSSAERLVPLILLYDATVDPGEAVDLPHRSGKAMERNPRRAAANYKKFSLFRVRRLTPPPGGFRRPDIARGRSWQLSVRHTVAGDQRWQPYGPGGRLRKRIWIGPHYRGPLDAPQKPELNVLSIGSVRE